MLLFCRHKKVTKKRLTGRTRSVSPVKTGSTSLERRPAKYGIYFLALRGYSVD